MTAITCRPFDIDERGVDDVLPAIPNAHSLLIHTGNIINRGFIYKCSPTVSQEIKLTCSKTLAKWMSGVNKHETKRLSVVDMDYCKITNTGKITEDRSNLKLTVKLFVVNAGPECVQEALNTVGSKLGTGFVETLILSLPGTSSAPGSPVSYEDLIGPYWEAAQHLTNFTFNDAAHHTHCRVRTASECEDHCCDDTKNHPSDPAASSSSSRRSRKGKKRGEGEDEEEDVYISWTMGLSDLDAASLAQLHQHAQEKPTLNQISTDACCSPPQDLVAICKEKDIQLLTHNDPREILNEEAMFEILSSHLTHDKDLMGWRVGWVVRYSALVKCRGIIHTKGYIVSLMRPK